MAKKTPVVRQETRLDRNRHHDYYCYPPLIALQDCNKERLWLLEMVDNLKSALEHTIEDEEGAVCLCVWDALDALKEIENEQ